MFDGNLVKIRLVVETLELIVHKNVFICFFLIKTCKMHISRECVVYKIVEHRPMPICEKNFKNHFYYKPVFGKFFNHKRG